MELAMLLVVLVFAELVCTVWLLARTKYGDKQYGKLERRIVNLEKKSFACVETPVEASTNETVLTAEDVAQASAILAALSGKKED